MFQYYDVGDIQCWTKDYSQRACEMSQWHLFLMSQPLRDGQGEDCEDMQTQCFGFRMPCEDKVD